MIGLLSPENGKRNRFIFFTFLSGIFVYLITFRFEVSLLYIIGLTLLFSVISTFFINRPNITLSNAPLSVVLPFAAIIGTTFFLLGFANFTLPFKLLVIFGFLILYYPIVLSLNIFLVVSKQGSVIPLYRVASTWNQILLSIVSIPLFAGVLKFNLYSIYIAVIILLITFVFNYYHLWSIRLDPEARKTQVGDLVLLSLLSSFLVFSSVISLSFIPSEAFLISLTASSMLMFTLTYSGGYLRNDISKKSIVNNLLLVAFFIVMTVLLS